MAYSYVVYTGNGVTTQFAVSFGYVRKEHILVQVNEVNTAFTWVNDSTVQVTPAPGAGVEVVVKRITPVASRLVDYTDGSTLVAADLDTDSLQHLYTEQELTDTVGGLEAFRGLYYGAYVSDPITDPFGGQIGEGDLYFNSVTKVMRVYTGGIWKNVTSDASLLRWVKTAAGGETSLSGLDVNTQPLFYTAGLELVYLNGALLQRGTDYVATNGTTITGLAALTNGDLVEVLAFTPLFGGALASTTAAGIVQLSSSTSSTSEVLAATPKAVKDAKDAADAAQGDATQALSDAAAAQGDATQALSDAAGAQGDATQALSDAAAAQSTANAALPKAGGTMTGVITFAATQPRLVTATAVASTSGTAIDFTGIPSWVKRVTVSLGEVSTNGTSDFLCRLGTSSGFVTSGYRGSYTSEVTNSNGTNVLSSGFFMHDAQAAASLCSGQGTIVLMGSNTWTMQGIFAHSTQGYINYFAGSLPLAGTLDRIRITTVNGTDTFDAGSINILYEG